MMTTVVSTVCDVVSRSRAEKSLFGTADSLHANGREKETSVCAVSTGARGVHRTQCGAYAAERESKRDREGLRRSVELGVRGVETQSRTALRN
ncbi:hypothetical protein TSAR_006351 [Trichomalopsis sarcophagae]|uniref:Uncharacterized protein n=1 Tax=Trichomalopsis sarcophagae TaxID=543379 RepID=A0A232FLU0_9HYME|nr:hypothetical protein TSAR_006351 [Trichomalopsis sarcophagae]